MNPKLNHRVELPRPLGLFSRSLPPLVALLLTACVADTPMPTEVIDLSPVITEDLPLQIMGPKLISSRPYPGATTFEHFSRSAPPYMVRNSLFTLLAHGGPHVDAVSHIFEDGGTVNDYELEQFVGPLRVVDVRALPRDEAVPLAFVKKKRIREGDVVVLLSGYRPPQKADEFPSYHYLSGEAAEYLASIPVGAFATDGWSADAPPGGPGRRGGPVVHAAFLLRGIPIVEQLVNVEAVLDKTKVVFVGFPLNIEEANGAPMRAAALVYP